MDLNKFTENSRKIVLSANSIAASNHNQSVEPLHLFRSLLEDELVKEILISNNIDLKGILDSVEQKLQELPKIKDLDLNHQSFSKSLLDVLLKAEKILLLRPIDFLRLLYPLTT